MSLTPNYNYTVAVVIPNWNGEKYLPEMLDSILEQTFKDYRVFVVDDQSTDNSIELLKAYSAKDSRIKYYVRDREPKGAQTCRNTGFALSEGAKYVVFFDNDDLIAPYCLEQRVQYMEEHSDLDFAIFPAMNFEKVPYDNPNTVWGYHFAEDTLQAMLHFTLPMVGWTNIYRRKSYLIHQLQWDERIKVMQDSDFNIQSLIKGCVFDYAEFARPDYFYRAVTKSISSKIYKQDSFDGYIIIIDKILSKLSPAQILQYGSDLRSYIVHFAAIMVNSSTHLYQLAHHSRIRGQRWFSLKIRLWTTLPYRYRLLNVFFRSELNQLRHHQQNWQQMSKKKAYEFAHKKSDIV